MDIVIIAQYLGNIERLDTVNGRFVYLGGILNKTDDVEISTTTFLHGLKRHTTSAPSFYKGCKITCFI